MVIYDSWKLLKLFLIGRDDCLLMLFKDSLVLNVTKTRQFVPEAPGYAPVFHFPVSGAEQDSRCSSSGTVFPWSCVHTEAGNTMAVLGPLEPLS